jgi:hypothetical protein
MALRSEIAFALINPAHLPHRVNQDFFQLFTHRKAVAADLDGANNVHPAWMPLAGRLPVHQHFGKIEKRHSIDTIGVVLWMVGIVGVVVIKRRFQLSERMLIFFARIGDHSQPIANRIKDCFLWLFQFGGVVSRSAFQDDNGTLTEEEAYPIDMQGGVYRTIVTHQLECIEPDQQPNRKDVAIDVLGKAHDPVTLIWNNGNRVMKQRTVVRRVEEDDFIFARESVETPWLMRVLSDIGQLHFDQRMLRTMFDVDGWAGMS